MLSNNTPQFLFVLSLAGMQAVRILKLFFQAISFVIFVYQSILAVRKFSTVSSIPSVETVDISDAKLPAIYICLKNTSFRDNFREDTPLLSDSEGDGHGI